MNSYYMVSAFPGDQINLAMLRCSALFDYLRVLPESGEKCELGTY